MKCLQCESPTKSVRGAHRYTESGLSNVTLLNVEIRSCPECGEREVVIPHIEELHRLMARTLAKRGAKLTPEQVKFLRKWLGLSSEDFALTMGVRPETVSRWESTSGTGYAMPPTAEHLLRLLVANQDPAERYPIDLFMTQPRAKAHALKFRGPDWKQATGTDGK